MRVMGMRDLLQEDAMLTRDKLIREYNARSASWPALVLVYGVLIGTMILTANAII